MVGKDNFLKEFNLICQKYPKNISVYYVSNLDSTVGITYSELRRLSEELSLFFVGIFESQEYIGVLLSEYLFLPCIILGIWKSGNFFAGIGYQYSQKDTLKFLNFLNVKYLISDVKDEIYEGKLIFTFHIHNQEYFIWSRELQKEKKKILAIDICYGIMTSGSTGSSKTVQVPWTCILPNALELSRELKITTSDCVFLASPCTFDPFFIELFLALLNGSSLIAVANKIKLSSAILLEVLFQPQKSSVHENLPSFFNSTKDNYFHVHLQFVKRKNVTVLQQTPSIFKRWRDNDIKDFILGPTTSLRTLILGGEKFPKEILNLKNKDNQTKIFNLYGITEISCWAFLNEVMYRSPDMEVSLGKPLDGITYFISCNNELHIGSQTRICFVDEENEVPSEISVYRNTGDVVELKNNELYYLSRSNQIVKKYGVKINLSKLEEVILNLNKSIKNCYCVFDEEYIKLVLFYLPKESETLNVKYSLISFEEFCKKGYQIPSEELKDIEKPDYFIQISKVPLNSHGKCNRQKLLKYFKVILKTPTPKTDIEKIFCKLWTEVLGAGKNGYSKSFSDLGGNSVLALQMIDKLLDEGVEVPQNFITKLLGTETFEDCLNFLSQGVRRKRMKVEDNVDGDRKEISIRWKFDLQKCVDATPIVFNHHGKDLVIVGSHSSKLCCLDAESGLEIWTISLGNRIESGFAVDRENSRGFIGCYDGFVYCVSVVDGKVCWKHETEDMVKSTPCVSSDGKIVYVGSYDKNLYCLSVTDGLLIKKLKLSEGGIFSSGVVSGTLKSFYIGTLDGTCVALDQRTNEILWKIKLQSPVFASPSLLTQNSQILFVEVVGVVHCLDANTGNEVWNFKANGSIYSTPTLYHLENVTQIFFGCHDEHVYCLESTEKPFLKWKQQVDSSVFARTCVITQESCSDRRICAVTTKGFIYLCDYGSGFVLSKFKLEGEVFSSPVPGKKKLFVGCRDNFLYSLDIAIND